MFGKSFKSKVIVPAVIILITLTVVLTSYMTLKFLSYSDAFINKKIRANTDFLKLHISDHKGHSRAAATSMAHNPKAIKAIKSRDRDEILQVFTPVLKLYQITYFTITDEKGTVLVRTYDPDHVGDSLLKQQNVRDALDGKISTYFEDGTAIRVSIRTGAPVYDTDGTLIGVISAGVRFDTDEAVDILKELLHAEVTIFFGESGIRTTLRKNEKRIEDLKLTPEIAKIILQDKREYFGDSDFFNETGETYKTFYIPLLNANNEAFAAFFIGIPMSELRAEVNTLMRNIILISFIGLTIAIIILYLVIVSISEPLLILSKEMNRIEDGSLSILIDAQGDDEVGRVGQALQRVADTVHKLIDNINLTISEHAKGNTDYHIDSHAFHGDYRLLAERIMELSSLGMRDQLTGLPNRRSFDNRLDLEWNRAKREKTSISILVIDVDKFKSYNDTFGHQQGDVVLQTVAKVLPLPIRRPVDFAARWGGEEFIILLPNTDSNGALHVAEKIRIAIENTEILSIDGGAAKKVTISIGVNTQKPTRENSIGSLISQADEALYRAKATGRNRVCRYEGDE